MEGCYATRKLPVNIIILSTFANKNGPLSVHSNGVSLQRNMTKHILSSEEVFSHWNFNVYTEYMFAEV